MYYVIVLNKGDNDPVKQLSIITPSKRFVSGRLQEQVKVSMDT